MRLVVVAGACALAESVSAKLCGAFERPHSSRVQVATKGDKSRILFGGEMAWPATTTTHQKKRWYTLYGERGHKCVARGPQNSLLTINKDYVAPEMIISCNLTSI